MRILILNWRDIKNPTSGGAEILTQEIAKYWVKWGHQVTQFSSSFQGALSKEIVDGVKIIRRGHPDVHHLFKSVYFLAFWYYQKKFKGKFDIVVDEIHGLPFFTPWYVKEKKVVLICEVAGELWGKVYGPIFGSLGRGVEKFYLKTAYKSVPFLTISQSSKQELIKEGIKPENITVLPMGISPPGTLKKFKKEKELTLLFVGRLSRPKGVEDAILALKKIRKEVPGAKLWIVGRGEEKYLRHLESLSSKIGVGDRVTFFGYVTDNEKFELMSRAHLLVHPSIKEGWGLTVVEANIVDTPVVVYDSPGLRDVLQQGNGTVSVSNTPEGLAKTIIKAVKNRQIYSFNKRMILKKNIGWDKTAKEALRILER